MKIAVVSDIHGNLTALEAVIADLKRLGADVVIQGGDVVANGARPAQVLDLIRECGWLGVCGNTDEMLWRPELLTELEVKTPSKHGLRRILFNDIAPRTRELVGEGRLSWLRTLPEQLCFDGITVLHASPGDLWRAPLSDANDNELIETYAKLKTRVVVYGHIHRPYVRTLNSVTIVNSGSVGLSWDGDRRASYVLLEDGKCTIRRVDYNIEQEIRELRLRNYPHADWLISILETGRYTNPSSARDRS